MKTLSDILALDAKRTQGRWQAFWAHNTALYSLIAMHDDGMNRTLLASFDELGSDQNRDNANFSAAAPDMVALLKSMQKKLEVAREALYVADKDLAHYGGQTHNDSCRVRIASALAALSDEQEAGEG